MKNNKTKYNHNNPSKFMDSIKEIIFGMEDGMVSTLGALTGVAVGTDNHFTVVLVGFVVVSVESISMGIGSYLSNKSVREIDDRKVVEEREELMERPKYEQQELREMYVRDGWSKTMASTMAKEAAKNKELFLKEMMYRELGISPGKLRIAWRRGMFMFFAYIAGGLIPIIPYLFIRIPDAIITSIIVTLFALFLMGAATTKFTKRNWLRAGMEMFILAGLAVFVGFLIGELANKFAS